MSYDGYLEIDTGGPEPAVVAEIGNCTSNVRPMWSKALTAAAGADSHLHETHGRTAGDVLPLLRAAVVHMEDHPAEYRELNPANGYGHYEGALNYLRRTAQLCAAHPKATLSWSR